MSPLPQTARLKMGRKRQGYKKVRVGLIPDEPCNRKGNGRRSISDAYTFLADNIITIYGRTA